MKALNSKRYERACLLAPFGLPVSQALRHCEAMRADLAVGIVG